MKHVTCIKCSPPVLPKVYRRGLSYRCGDTHNISSRFSNRGWISKICMHCRRLQRAQEELEYYGAFAEHWALWELHAGQLCLQRCTVFSGALRRFQEQHHFHETYKLPVLQSAPECSGVAATGVAWPHRPMISNETLILS